MKIVVLSGSIAGSKTRSAARYTAEYLQEHYAEHETALIDLAEYAMEFADGRNYLDYRGDTGRLAQSIMESEVVLLGSPIYQASIPGVLKNVFDLLPGDALRDKVVGMFITAGSQRHNLIPEIQLKPILSYLKAHIVETYVFIEERSFQGSSIVDDDVRFRLQRLIDDALTLADVYARVRELKDEQYGF